MDVEVQIELKGSGVVKSQSVNSGTKLNNQQTVVLEAI
jgi:hypothetical protein